jgi:hypothetical protein
MSGSIVTEARTIHIYDRGKNNSLRFMKTYMIKFMEYLTIIEMMATQLPETIKNRQITLMLTACLSPSSTDYRPL